MADDQSEKLKDVWWSMRHSKTAKILGGITASLILLLAILFGLLSYYDKLPWSDRSDEPISDSASDNRTTPLATENAKFQTVPIAVMIENLVTIRPQAGLSQADIVYEALVEGGITRFLAIYTTTEPITKIGPIRSTRTYYVDWAEEYGGIFAYVGGSPEALGMTNTSEYLTDLNQFYHAQYYYRDDVILAPHNLFSNSELFSYALRDLALRPPTSTDPTHRTTKTEPSADELPVTQAPITIDYSNSDYVVAWRYDPSNNVYRRLNGGGEHRDANTNEQLSARTIIVQRVSTTLLEAATGRLDLETQGEGSALLFQDGKVRVGTWIKTERGQRTIWLDETGEQWQTNAGTTWIEVVTSDTPITY